MTTNRRLRAAANALQRQPHLRDRRGYIAGPPQPERAPRRESRVYGAPAKRAGAMPK